MGRAIPLGTPYKLSPADQPGFLVSSPGNPAFLLEAPTGIPARPPQSDPPEATSAAASRGFNTSSMQSRKACTDREQWYLWVAR